MKKVAIQGKATSYHHQAAKKFFGDSVEIMARDTFKDVFKSVENGNAQFAIVAVENSIYGAINPVFDLLLKMNLWVCGEITLHIHHCLIGLPGARKENLKEVYSQVMALTQCQEYLDNNFISAKHIEHYDTVASVQLVKESKDTSKAAIASKEAAEMYHMQILDENIEDNPQNFTRFLVLTKEKISNAESNKTSIVLQTPADKSAGSLHKALGAFVGQNISLSSLNSRPVVGKNWHYMFYIDLAVGVDDLRFQLSLSQLKDMGCSVTILGSYKGGEN